MPSSILSGIRWRLHSLWDDMQVTYACISADSRQVPGHLARWGRDPLQNRRWRLRRQGLAILRDAYQVASEEGFALFLVFGTLLGHVREQGFIPHDDDVDLAILHEDWQRLESALPRFREMGYRVKTLSDCEVRLTSPKRGLVPVDIFRFEQQGDTAVTHFGHRTRKQTYSFPRQLVVPPRMDTFQGVPVHVPADAEGFLAHHYGPGWRVPNTRWDYRADPQSLR